MNAHDVVTLMQPVEVAALSLVAMFVRHVWLKRKGIGTVADAVRSVAHKLDQITPPAVKAQVEQAAENEAGQVAQQIAKGV